MKAAAIPLSSLRLVLRADLGDATARLHLVDEAARDAACGVHCVVGLVIAPGHLDPVLGAVAIVAIAAGAGGAGVLNMWYDVDIDAVMTRTARRPIPRGNISRAEALAFGLVLTGGAVVALALATNVKAAALLAFTIFFYVVVYTVWLKRSTPQNIVIGGAAGALPPVIGWTAATGDIGLEPLILFLIVFLWTPPHFWALSINRTHEYARAGVPMLPVVAGRAADRAADPRLQSPSSAGFHAAVGARVCRRDLRRCCRSQWNDLHCARGSTAPEPRGQWTRRLSPIRILCLVPVRSVCDAVGQQRRPMVAHVFPACCRDGRIPASGICSATHPDRAYLYQSERRRGLICDTLYSLFS